jgi:surface polysaccharide O-acyltransferase-like enzyme
LEPKPAAAFPVDLIRPLAIVLVIFLHATAFPYAIPQNVTPTVMWNWWTINIYDTLGRVAVTLFVMLSGALLLDPAKVNEPLRVFFKKRFSRVGIPIVFWGATFFAWQFLVNKQAFTIDNVINGVLLGPYYHFWFLYLLVGLYLVTPILRVAVAYVDRKTFRYFMILWFVGTITLATFRGFSVLDFNPSIFVFTGWIGYFLLGIYLQQVKVRPLILILLMISGFTVAIVGTYFVTADIGERLITFFHDSLSFNIIAASGALFLLLCQIKPENVAKNHLKAQRLLHWISQNTLPIYLFHVIVLETLEKGYLGVALNMNTVNPLLEIPLITALTLALCILILYPISKVPYVKKIIG